MTHTFLLEVGLEELPAADIIQAEKQLIKSTEEFLMNNELKFEKVFGFSTPRRLAVKVNGLAERQPDKTETVRGPAKKIAQDDEGNWTKAAIGFSKGQGGSIEDLIIKNENGEPYIYFEKDLPGKPAFDLLQNINQIIKKIEFSKHMKWGDYSYRYIRPIHWVVALLDEEIVPFEIFEVQTDRYTLGHRFLGRKIKLENPNEYEEKLQKEFVIADRSVRKQMIVSQMKELCEEKNWEVPLSYDSLLDEVTNLVEYPTAFYGSFEEEFLDVPEEVLETSMIDHQRYFPVRDNSSERKLLPFFISIRNGDENHIENVAKGNEKVLSARLADATFFYHEDQKYSIRDFAERLKNVIYYDKLGTIYDKQTRATNIADAISDIYKLSPEEIKDLKRVTSIYKFDLVTQVVGEFPDLQGNIGEIYAKERSEDSQVASAIGSQYLPLSATDGLPKTKIGKLTALIDKLDTLIQFFSINAIPTGSNDPHALRRQAIGIVRLILSLDNTQVEITELIKTVIEASNLTAEKAENIENNRNELIIFILNRLENIMETQFEIPYDIRKSVLHTDHKNIDQMLKTAENIQENKNKESFKEVTESITRVLNITKNQEKIVEMSKEFIETPSEKLLYEKVLKLKAQSVKTMTPEKKIETLKKLAPLITDFFDENMIMVDDLSVKNNRLAILNNIAKISKYYADFSQIRI